MGTAIAITLEDEVAAEGVAVERGELRGHDGTEHQECDLQAEGKAALLADCDCPGGA